MKQIKYFYLEHCPHCKKADRIIADLQAQHPEYRNVVFEKIEESKNPEIADSFDYYYVPCFFIEGEKLLEGVPSAQKVEAALKKAVE